MPTTKYRVNLSVSPDVKHALQRLAKRDRISVATKTLDLVQKALEIEEDATLLQLAKKRERIKTKYLSHTNAWV